MLLNVLLCSCLWYTGAERTNEAFQENILSILEFLKTCSIKNDVITCDGKVCHENATNITKFQRKACQCTGYTGNGSGCGFDSELEGYHDKGLQCTTPPCVKDNCPTIPNSGQEDLDRDGIGDSCDDDMDNDSVKQPMDNCPTIPNPDQEDADQDGLGDVCDPCPNNHTKQCECEGSACGELDSDIDGIKNEDDNCLKIPNPAQADTDQDGVGDACDNCPRVANRNQTDKDGDNLGDACDTSMDIDEDGVQDDIDNCPQDYNPDQLDTDLDYIGDKCDWDKDNDTIPNLTDNCELVPNPDQSRTIHQKYGDACLQNKDGDSRVDSEDVCPERNDVQVVDFRDFQQQTLAKPTVGREASPLWTIRNNGAEIEEEANSMGTIALARSRFEGVDFAGTMFVRCCRDDDYVGFVFSYQNLSNYYAFMWKSVEQHGDMGQALQKMQLRLFHINHTVSQDMLWSSPNSLNPEVKALWSYPAGRAKFGWKYNQAYRYSLIHRPKIGLIRITVDTGKDIVDSGNILNNVLKGGRIGILSFSQEHTIFSHVKYRCNDKLPKHVHAELPEPLQHLVEVDEKNYLT